MTETDVASEPAVEAEERAAAPAVAVGELLGRYRLRRVIGEGGMGRVYLARDELLGRSVALKLMRPDRVGATTVERVLAEARATARLEHPHVVRLYDAAVERGWPFLALEYIEGDTLREHAARSPLSVDEVMRIARAVAGALVAAHASGVRHCDLKPGNVLMGRDGQPRVLDFGIAVLASSPAGSSRGGTPAYMAPEQWRREPLSDAVDVWALGVMVHELLDGRHPLSSPGDPRPLSRLVVDAAHPPAPLLRAGVPEPMRALLAASLAREPSARPSAAVWQRTLGELLDGGALLAVDGPFRGLSPFLEEHAALFFGRDTDIEAFLALARDEPILPIAGPSGAGKSSFLHAGIVPRLRARGPWLVLSMRPGRHPFRALAEQLLLAVGAGGRAPAEAAIEQLAYDLHETPTLLALRLATLASVRDGQVLLAIDQLEELFTHGTDAQAERFLQVIGAAADDAREPVRVIFTLRDDFIGRVTTVQRWFILRASPDGLRRTITGPVERADYHFDPPSLVDTMMTEIAGSPVCLPLLQFACRALWEARDEGQRALTAAAYARIGGVAGALARHAEVVVAELSASEHACARQVMVRLVTDTTTRRVVEREALLDGLPTAAATVVDRMVQARLLTQGRGLGEHQPTIELAHESLLTSWTQLRRWIDESSEQRRLLDDLDMAARPWERRGRRAEETWGAEDIGAVRRRARQLDVVLPARAEAFLAAGEARAARDTRRARMRRALGATLAVLVTSGSLAVASLYRDQKLEAERQSAALRRAAVNLGHLELAIRVFDRDAHDLVPVVVDPATLPALDWSLFAPAEADVHTPGAPLPSGVVRTRSRRIADATLRVSADAPGGMAFLRIDGRGRAGERCAPSWIRLQSIPGYAAADAAVAVIDLDVPSCRASREDLIDIPAGPFVYGGPGDPPTAYADYVVPERVTELGHFSIDRTEVSNAAYRPFARLERWTGYSRPNYPADGFFRDSGLDDHPVTAVDGLAAAAYCRYMGKALPTDDEWVKAARGGLVIDGAPNPIPRRLYPWGRRLDRRCTNIFGDVDGATWMEPVGARPCGASPYGVLDLSGNASEWVAAAPGSAPGQLRHIRGGDADSPPELQHATTVFENEREARYFDFATGVRCVLHED